MSSPITENKKESPSTPNQTEQNTPQRALTASTVQRNSGPASRRESFNSSNSGSHAPDSSRSWHSDADIQPEAETSEIVHEYPKINDNTKNYIEDDSEEIEQTQDGQNVSSSLLVDSTSDKCLPHADIGNHFEPKEKEMETFSAHHNTGY